MAHEVKGIWFASGRAFLAANYDEATYRSLLRDMGEWAPVLDEPDHSEWYPEAALQNMLRAIDTSLARGRAEDFTSIMRRSTHYGIGKFFRILMRLGSAGFVLRKVPVMWSRIRRGPGGPTVDSEPERSIVRYRDFPYFDDRLYRLLTVGSLQGLVETSTGRIPVVNVLEHGRTHLDVEVIHPSG